MSHNSLSPTFSDSSTPSPNPLLSALLATLPHVEEKTFTSLVIPVVKQKEATPATTTTLLPPPPAQQSDNTRTVPTKINSRTSFTDLLGSMLDTGDGSPGDSDYESSQDIGVGVKQVPPPTSLYQEAARKKVQVKRLTLPRNEAQDSQSRMTDFFSSQKSFT